METAYRVVYREDQFQGFALFVYSILSYLTVLVSYPIVYHVEVKALSTVYIYIYIFNSLLSVYNTIFL